MRLIPSTLWTTLLRCRVKVLPVFSCSINQPPVALRYCDRAIAAMMLSNKHRIVRITRASSSAQQPSKGVSRFVSDEFIPIETARLIAIDDDGGVFNLIPPKIFWPVLYSFIIIFQEPLR